MKAVYYILCFNIKLSNYNMRKQNINHDVNFEEMSHFKTGKSNEKV